MQYIGMVAAVLTSASFIPQAIQVIRTKDTSGISLTMYSMFVFGVVLWTIHGIIIQDVAVLFANIVTFIFAATVLVYKIKYK